MPFPFLQSYNSHIAQPISLGNLRAIHLLKTLECCHQSVSSINKFRLLILQSQNTHKRPLLGVGGVSKIYMFDVMLHFSANKADPA